METSETQDIDFNSDDYNSFFYTQDKQLKRMDDEFLLSKVTEIYPDFNRNNTENVLKQVILIIINDGRLISRLEKEYDLSPTEFLKILYRNYDFIFNKCFVTRVQKTVKNKKYAKRVSKRYTKPFNRGCK